MTSSIPARSRSEMAAHVNQIAKNVASNINVIFGNVSFTASSKARKSLSTIQKIFRFKKQPVIDFKRKTTSQKNLKSIQSIQKKKILNVNLINYHILNELN